MAFTYTFPFNFEENKLIVQADWDNDGDYNDTGEYLTDRVLAAEPIIIERGRDQIRQLAPPMAGRGDFELDNVSKDYSPKNSSGPLYGNLIPGRPVRIRRTQGDTFYNLFHGYLDDLPQHPEPERKSVSAPCLGSLSKLRAQAEGQKIGTAVYQSIRTDEALGYILDAIGWSTSTGAFGRNLDTGQTTLDWWWLDNEDAFSAAVQLLNTEGPGAALYEDGLGRIVFESRHYRLLTARCTASQVTFNASGTSEPLISPPYTYNPRLKEVINVCTITQKARTAGTSTEVWALGETVNLGAGETRRFQARASDPFTNAVQPTSSGGDYTVTAGSLSTATLNRTSGQSVTITLTAGSVGASVTGLRLRAQPVTVTNTNQISNTVSSTASQAKYGTRVYPLDVRAEIPINTAQDFCNAVVGAYQEPRAIAEITLVGASSDHMEQILNREISDRVTLVESQTGTTGEFFVEKIKHQINYGGKLHSAQFGIEEASDNNYLVWGTGLWGTGLWGY